MEELRNNGCRYHARGGLPRRATSPSLPGVCSRRPYVLQACAHHIAAYQGTTAVILRCSKCALCRLSFWRCDRINGRNWKPQATSAPATSSAQAVGKRLALATRLARARGSAEAASTCFGPFLSLRARAQCAKVCVGEAPRIQIYNHDRHTAEAPSTTTNGSKTTGANPPLSIGKLSIRQPTPIAKQVPPRFHALRGLSSKECYRHVPLLSRSAH